MSRNFYGDLTSDQYQETLKPLLIPIALTVPDRVADTMPRSKLRQIRGTFLFRFFPKLPPSIGHTITFKDHRWRIVGINHSVQVKNSPGADSFPQVETEYLGAIT